MTKELLLPTEEAAKKIRETANEGMEKGEIKIYFHERPDLDVKTSIILLREAGFNLPDKEGVAEAGVGYIGKGEESGPEGKVETTVNIDTSAGRHGLKIIRDSNDRSIIRGIIIDHHGEKSSDTSSASSLLLRVLEKSKLLNSEKDPERYKRIRNLVEFTTQEDNKTHPDLGERFENSHLTILGNHRRMSVADLEKFFLDDGHDVLDVLSKEDWEEYGIKSFTKVVKGKQLKDALRAAGVSEAEVKKIGYKKAMNEYGIAYVSKQKKFRISVDPIEEHKRRFIDGSMEALEEIKKDNRVIRLGSDAHYDAIIVARDKREVPAGADAIGWFCEKEKIENHSYVVWDEKENGFFVNSSGARPIDDFAQTINVRGRMLLKNNNKRVLHTLSEVLMVLSDGQAKPEGDFGREMEEEMEKELADDKWMEETCDCTGIDVKTIDEFYKKVLACVEDTAPYAKIDDSKRKVIAISLVKSALYKRRKKI